MRCDIRSLHEEIAQKDEMLQDLSQTILKKGQQNQRLSEAVSNFKNQLIVEQIF